MSCEIPGYLPTVVQSEDVVIGETITLALEMAAGASISGEVTGAADGALEGAWVSLVGQETDSHRWAQTDADGVYRLATLPADTYRVQVSHPGYVTYELSRASFGVKHVSR